MTTLEEKQRNRFQRLKVVYERAYNDVNRGVCPELPGKHTGARAPALRKAETYLAGARLIYSSVRHLAAASTALIAMPWAAVACDNGPSLDSRAEVEAGAGAGAGGISMATDAGPECHLGQPPPVRLTSLAGEQLGVQGSYCVSNSADGCGACVDVSAEPQTLTVLSPGDEITISMPDGRLMAGSRCQPACPPTLRIRTLCKEDHQTVLFDEDDPLLLDLPEGAYSVWVDSHFEASAGITGQLYVGFGLVVTPNREPAVVNLNGPVECPQETCPQLNASNCQELDAFEAVSLSSERCLQCQGTPCVDASDSCDSFPCSEGARVIQGCCTDSDCNGLAPFCGRGAGPHGVCVVHDPL